MSCVSTTDRPFASLLAKRCLAPSLLTETCCIRTHGKLSSGRYQRIDLRFINVTNVLVRDVRDGASVACNVRLIASQRAVTFFSPARYDHDITGSQLQIFRLCSHFTQVLFPLLDSVKKLSGQASDEKVDTSGSILIHHSRNTAQKQWAETQVRYCSLLSDGSSQERLDSFLDASRRS